MKKKIKIDFSDFWGGFNKTDNYFYNLLKEEFDIEISSNPDYLFFSVFGNTHQQYNCTKIFYTGENVLPDMNYCDYSFSFDYLDNVRNYRLPHYLLYDGYYELVNKTVTDDLVNRKFCNFVASNSACPTRNSFVEKLTKYKKVDSGGRHMNNLGYVVEDKLKFQSEYKFSIAFENEAYRPQHSGYTTEKILQPMSVNSIPIYWGNLDIGLEFNTKSFVNCGEFKSLDNVIEYVIELDKNPDKYLEMLKQNWLIDIKITENNKIENIKAFLYKIFE